MQRKYDDRKHVTVYFDEPEYKWVELQAAGNISAWCREKLLEGRTNHRAEDLPQSRAVRVAERRVAADEVAGGPRTSDKRAAKTCAHGVKKGVHCWQCGGMAVME
jgi:hypothetical protein